jgi:2-keto-3-deoxy-6-phosphogluconate aldolase
MTASSHDIGDLLNRAPVIPVIVIDDEAVAVPLARALVAGGLTVLEVTLRTKCALASIKRIVAEVPDAVVGAGTILTQADVAASVEAGAAFLVSPGSTPGRARRHARQRRRALTGCSDRVGGHGVHRAWIGTRQVLPGQTRRRDRLPQGARGTHPRLPLLSDRGHRPAVPRTFSPYPMSPASAARGSPRRTPWPRATGAGSRRWPARLRNSAQPEPADHAPAADKGFHGCGPEPRSRA